MATKFEFRVEVAPSGRAKCKACKDTLPKDAIRMGVKQVIDETRAAAMEDRSRAMAEATQWYHPKISCFGSYRKTAKWWIDNGPLVDEVVGFDDIDEEEQENVKEVIEDLREGRGHPAGKPKSKAKAKPKVSPASSKASRKPTSPTKKKAEEESSSSGGDKSEDSSNESSGSDSGPPGNSNGDVTSTIPGKRKPVEGSSEQGKKGVKKHRVAENDNRDNRGGSDNSEDSRSGSSDEGPSSSDGSEEEEMSYKGGKSKGKTKKGKENEPKKTIGGGFQYEAKSLSSDLVEKIRREGEELMKKNVNQLKEMLKGNSQLCNGNKVDLVKRVAEAKLLGRLPKCPECGGGTMKWNANTGEFSCPGFFDDEAYQRCGYITDHISRPDWVDI